MRASRATDGEVFGVLVSNPRLPTPVKLDIRLVEAGRFNMLPTEADVTDRIERIAKNMKLTKAQLLDKLKAKALA